MRVALTWDDGPSDWTAPILDLLALANAQATFFVCGWSAAQQPGLLARAHEEGHDIGNHTWSHPRVTRLSDEKVVDELESCSRAIKFATGKSPTLWRAPHFDHDARTDAIALGLGLGHVGATIDPGDWANEDGEMIARIVLSRLRDGAVVDLHDGVPPDGGTGTRSRQPTVDALALILRQPGVEWLAYSQLTAALAA